MNFLDSLTQDHLLIRKYLPLLKTSSNYIQRNSRPPTYFDGLLSFLEKFVAEFHHGREEEILFSKLALHPKLKEGGPSCCYYMGLRMMETTSAQESDPQYQPHPELRQHLTPQCHLQIPVEDHAKGAYYLHALLQEWQQFYDKAIFNKDVIVRSLNSYHDLLILHSRKEDECLFSLCRQCFSDKDLEQMWEQQKSMEEIFSSQKWPEIEAALTRLAEELQQNPLRSNTDF